MRSAHVKKQRSESLGKTTGRRWNWDIRGKKKGVGLFKWKKEGKIVLVLGRGIKR